MVYSKRNIIFLFLAICLASTGPAQAELYRWVDDNGLIHFSDKKTQGQSEQYTPESKLSTYSNSQFLQKPAADNSDRLPFKQRRDKPDIEKLFAVKFPVQPTDTNVAKYIQEIYAISRGQKQYLKSDPQVTLLMQVGGNHLDVLIDATNHSVGWHNYGIEVIKKLATEQHKKHILQALKTYSKYAKVIYTKGWHYEFQGN